MRFLKRPYGKDEDHRSFRDLSFEFAGKIWVCSDCSDQQIKFRVAENGGNDSKTFFRRWLKEFNYTQKQIAEKIKCSQSYISKIENGDRRPPQVLIDLMLRSYDERRAARKKAQQKLEEGYVKMRMNDD